METAGRSHTPGTLTIRKSNNKSHERYNGSATATKTDASATKPQKNHQCEIKSVQCTTDIYKEGLCKVHYLEKVQRVIRQTVRKVYKDPETAFAAFNFRGEATIGLEDILGHMIVKKAGFDLEDVKSYLLREKVFKHE